MNSDQQRKETAIKQAVGKMMEIYSIARDAAERVGWELSNAIGWGIPELQEPVISYPPPDSGANNPPVIPNLRQVPPQPNLCFEHGNLQKMATGKKLLIISTRYLMTRQHIRLPCQNSYLFSFSNSEESISLAQYHPP